MTAIALPDFELTVTKVNQQGNIEHTPIKLNEFINNTDNGLILYFYPKDNTPGCTNQAMDFTENLIEFLGLGYVVIGVSRDSSKSHENFICKKNLQIPLISDTDEKLCQHFDVIQEKNMYGKQVMGVVRSTFVFDNQGNLIHELRKVKAKEHAEKLLKLLGGEADSSSLKF